MSRHSDNGVNEIAEQIRSNDWSETHKNGPTAFLVTVNLMLHSPFPTIMSWRPEVVFFLTMRRFYAYCKGSGLSIRALVMHVPERFSEAWDLVVADLEACLD